MNDHLNGAPIRRREVLLSVFLTTGLTSVASWGESKGTTKRPFIGVELASDWHDELPVADYAVSEKFDGVRAIWNGQQLFFRSGRLIHAPAWFTQSLPTYSLDGELWMGRGSFERLSAVVRTLQPDDAAWRNVRYVVFDMPISDDSSPDASNLTFEQRWALLKARLGEFAGSSQPSWLQLSTQYQVASLAALKAHLHEVTSNGAEGLVLHRWSAHWMPGRSSAVKKLKLQPDAEAIVVGHLPGKGKYKGQLGALNLQMPTGQGFLLGSGFSDAQRALPPSIGSIVTYRFRGHTAAGIPKFASFLRVREIE